MRKIFKLVSMIKKMPKQNEISYYPELERKSNLVIFKENFIWLIKHKEVNEYYYVYGLDVKGSNIKEFSPYNKIKLRRDYLNKSKSKQNYLCLLQDKFVFGQLLNSLNIPTPINYYLGAPNKLKKLKNLPDDGYVECFAKDLTGLQGENVFPVKLKEQEVFVNEKSHDLKWLQKRMKGRFLIQSKIVQHKELKKIYPDSVNTIRLLTINKDENVKVLSAVMKFGANGSNTDNWASGGLIIKIDIDEGTLQKEGYFKNIKEGRVESHPNTFEEFLDFKIPFYNEACDLAISLHQSLYGIHSIGWDIAITNDGPVIIEGNDNWDVAMQQLFYKEEIQKEFLL